MFRTIADRVSQLRLIDARFHRKKLPVYREVLSALALRFNVCGMKHFASTSIRTALRYLLSTLLLAFLAPIATGQVWTVIAFDAKGDGRDPRLPDAAQMSYRYDKDADMLWFRIALYGTPDRSTAVTIAVDTGSDSAPHTNWWGTNKDFRFNKLVTVRSGVTGIADVEGVNRGEFTNIAKDNLQVRTEADSVLIGVKRTDLTDAMKLSLIAAVGSDKEWNDDIPNTLPATIDLSAPRPTRRLRELDFARDNYRFPAGYRTVSNNAMPKIVESGRGRTSLVLIPGCYSGPDVFDGFIARNASKYRFLVITPPGLNDTPPRPLPSPPVSYAQAAWTRRLEHDVEQIIKTRRLSKPIIVTHGFPGSLVAHDLAAQHPELVAGVIDVSGIPVQPFPSPKDPTGKTPTTPEERIVYVDEGWAQNWFKYVTPETWESNNYPTAMFIDDATRGEQIRQAVESNPLPVKIEYLTEFMASDQSDLLSQLTVPLLALRPGFNEKLLKDPATGWFKTMLQDPWDKFTSNPRIHVETIPNGHARLLDEQPALVDGMIDEFVADTIQHDAAARSH